MPVNTPDTPPPLFEIRVCDATGIPFRKRLMAALPDLGVAGLYLLTFFFYFDLPQAFISGIEGIMIVELAVLLFMPALIYILFRRDVPGARATRGLSALSSAINVLSVLFLLALAVELLWMTSRPEGRAWLPGQMLFLAGSRIFSFLITRDTSAKALRFVACTTLRLVMGAFIGVLTYCICCVGVAVVVTPQVSWGMGWLIIGYTYFSAMALYQMDRPALLAILADQDIVTPETMDRLQVVYPRFERGSDGFNIKT